MELVQDYQDIQCSLKVYCAIACLVDSKGHGDISLIDILDFFHLQPRRHSDGNINLICNTIDLLRECGIFEIAPDYLNMKRKPTQTKYHYILATCDTHTFVDGFHYARLKRNEVVSIIETCATERTMVSAEIALYLLCWIRSRIYLKNRKGIPQVLAASMEEISKQTDIPLATVRRALALLKRLDMIPNKKVIYKRGERMGSMTLYTFPWCDVEREFSKAVENMKR